MFFVKSNIARFTAYQTFARNMLKEILKIPSKRAHLVYDVYVSPSIKDIDETFDDDEMMRDDKTFAVFPIGSKQQIEGNINDLLSNCNFKNELLNFLSMLHYLVINSFFCSVNNQCTKFDCVDQEFK